MVSPDGASIAFLMSRDSEIWVMGAGGEDPHLVWPLRDYVMGMSWSPDGKRMAWVRDYVEGNQPHLFLEVDNWNDKQVTTVLSNIDLPAAALSSDLDVMWLKDGRVLYTLPEPPPHERDRNYWEIHTNWRTGEVSGRPRRLT